MKYLLLSFLAICFSSQAIASDAYSVTDALADAQSETLHLVGKGLLYGYDTIPSCLFRNSKVLVLHGYCASPEVPAGDIQVYSPSRAQMVTIHAESLDGKTGISKENPNNYAQRYWYVVLGNLTSDLQLNISFANFAAFYEARYKKYPPNCLVSLDYTKCDAPLASYGDSWLPQSVSFRKSPSQSWRTMLNLARSLAKNTFAH